MSIGVLIERLEVLRTRGLVACNPGVAESALLERFPEDLRVLYQHTDGLTLFPESDYPYMFFPLAEITGIHENYLFELEVIVCGEKEISRDWCLIAARGGDEFVALDLHPSRLGRCYDVAYREKFFVISLEFSSLLQKLLDPEGERPDWYEQGWTPPATVCE